MVNVFQDKVFGGWTLDSAPKGVNKWSGVEAYCRYRDLDPAEVLAIGDGDNDVELLERAAHSCAMSHATDRAKAAAQRHAVRRHGRMESAPRLPLIAPNALRSRRWALRRRRAAFRSGERG